MWRRLREWLWPREITVPEEPPPPVEIKSEAETTLERLEHGPLQDEQVALDAFEQVAQQNEARAIELARRVAAKEPPPARLVQRLAERMSARGDDAGARAMLGPLLAEPDVSLPAIVLAAEIEERIGNRRDALALYERVLARDVDYPRAKERASRLREARPAERTDFATLAAGGALARGRYRIERELGRGGAGTVFAARDLHVDRAIALKIYHQRGRTTRERLRHEARTAAMLEHPGVVRVFDLDEELAAIAMELVDGGSVRRELTRGNIEATRARRWMSTAIEALRYVHARGVVHRDLKPSNMLLREDDSVVLSDFGLAGSVGETRARDAGEGTLAYMPPEQRRGDRIAPAADVYALGSTIRELCAACPPLEPKLGAIARACVAARPEDRPELPELASALS